VTVRGQFADLTEEAHRYLAGAQPEHDLFVSAYTPEGTFTYDKRIAFFNLRYEIRGDQEATTSSAEAAAMAEAELFLKTMRFGFKKLRATVVDASAIWSDVQRRNPSR
jgi:Family of unknown function (DUF6204)